MRGIQAALMMLAGEVDLRLTARDSLMADVEFAEAIEFMQKPALTITSVVYFSPAIFQLNSPGKEN
ncbi:hypothetical protein [Chromobacterium phragmitis]|uniref:hypothetical protein n=1 Tax=Chromobacterium phragmitis TaxID=2202141 RepID=UPI0011AE846F|nr:hypothetical protein [Chromobacterium phragmitis]